jgi:hypothetical protein
MEAMKDDAQSADKLADLRPETREFLAKLEPSDLRALQGAIPLLKRLLAFGTVAKWIILSAAIIIIGASNLWDSVANIVKHLRTP